MFGAARAMEHARARGMKVGEPPLNLQHQPGTNSPCFLAEGKVFAVRTLTNVQCDQKAQKAGRQYVYVNIAGLLPKGVHFLVAVVFPGTNAERVYVVPASVIADFYKTREGSIVTSCIALHEGGKNTKDSIPWASYKDAWPC
jgi:hypothetical protein